MQKQELMERITAEYQRTCAEMEQKQYVRVEHLIPRWTATLFGTLVPLPAALGVYGLFQLRWNGTVTEIPLGVTGMLATLGILFGSVALHEWLHCFFWSLRCKEGWKGVHYVFIWSALMPLSHCREPLDCRSYSLGVLAPFVLMGGGFSVLALLFPSRLLLLAAVMNLLCAGGDLLIALNLIGCRYARIFDHPTQCGFAAFFSGEDRLSSHPQFYSRKEEEEVDHVA